jgi:hypothetical protein
LFSTLFYYFISAKSRFKDIPEHIRGTYAGLCSEPFISHLQQLGVTAVELEPIHHHVDEKHLLDKAISSPKNGNYYFKLMMNNNRDCRIIGAIILFPILRLICVSAPLRTS